ncbi:MAG: GNAT family N-acetyltransferase [Gemmatimonadaceae bacterium]
MTIRRCRESEHPAIAAVINDGAEAYRGVIPVDCWHEPYMSLADLERDISAGVVFWGYETLGILSGVMGMQRVQDVDLIRHAYVRREQQGRGIGRALIEHLRQQTTRPILVGTWAAARWAIEFYQRRGFDLVAADETPALLRRYWSIADRQIETSVVLRATAGGADTERYAPQLRPRS